MKTSLLILRLLAFAASLLPSLASALILTGKGDPVNDAGWPAGALTVANLKCRVGWWEGPPFGGGQWSFLYRGDDAAFAETLAAFAAIRTPALDLVIHDGAGESPFIEGKEGYDWSFTVWVPANWNHLYNNPKSVFGADQPQFRQPVDPPRLDLFVRGVGVDFSKVKVPANVRVKDQRAAAAGVDLRGGGVVRADFYDMNSGKPVAGARLSVSRLAEGRQNQAQNYEAVGEGISDADGRAVVERIAVGNVRVTVTAPGYAPRLLGYDRFDAAAFRPFIVSLAEASTLSGLVVDSNDKPVKGATVRADSITALDGRGYPPPDSPNPASITTDDAGRFALNELPAGFATLSVRAEGYHFGDLFTLHDVPGKGEVRVVLDRSCKVHVTVTDKEGKALAKFENAPILVQIEPKGGPVIGSWGGSAEVKPDGTYEFAGMPAGEYRVTSHPNPSTTGRIYALEKIVKVEAGASVPVTIVYP